jgi:DNA mismatch repair protein PMS2
MQMFKAYYFAEIITVDFEELIGLIAERSANSEIIRPSKVRRILASRACRKSVMIGKALKMKEMRQVRLFS